MYPWCVRNTILLSNVATAASLEDDQFSGIGEIKLF